MWGLVMEALSHRRAEVMDMGPVPGNFGRTRLSLTCPSRLALSCSFRKKLFLPAHQILSSSKSLIYDGHQIFFFLDKLSNFIKKQKRVTQVHRKYTRDTHNSKSGQRSTFCFDSMSKLGFARKERLTMYGGPLNILLYI
jgi:hypothetical protein